MSSATEAPLSLASARAHLRICLACSAKAGLKQHVSGCQSRICYTIPSQASQSWFCPGVRKDSAARQVLASTQGVVAAACMDRHEESAVMNVHMSVYSHALTRQLRLWRGP